MNKVLKLAHSIIGVNMGNALLMAAGHYPSFQDLLLEIVQNAIDESPKLITIKVNMKKRDIIVTDDGNGASRNKMDNKMKQIFLSDKEAGKIGEWGMGLMAPLGKCRVFTFTSCPKGKGASQGYIRWTFNTENIRNQGSVSIPCEKLPHLKFNKSPNAKQKRNGHVNWRSCVSVRGLTKDTQISRFKLDEFIVELVSRYGTAIKKRDIVIVIRYVNEKGLESSHKVEVKEYQGDNISFPDINDDDAGTVQFNLYRALHTPKGPEGKVCFGVMGDDSRLDYRQFALSIRSNSLKDFINRDALDALKSGVFEGEILAENVKMNPTRRSFKKNDALAGMLVALDEWFKKHAREYVDDNRSMQRHIRYQDLAIRALKHYEPILKDILPDFVANMKSGTVGVGHAKCNTIGQQSTKHKATRGGAGQRRELSGEHPGSTPAAKKSQENHTQSTVSGPGGKRRSMVRSHSLGLQIEFSEMKSDPRVYEYNAKEGVLKFNIRHPHFAKCEKPDTSLMTYIVSVLAIVMTLEQYSSINDNMRKFQRKAMLQFLELIVPHISSKSGLNRGPSTK